MFEGIFLAIQGAASQGIIWGIMKLGVYITFKVLDFPDLTVDGSFALGGAVSAILISNGMNPFITLIFSFLAGSLAGLATGILNTKLQIPGILAGILSMIALYSINIRVMGGRPNIPLLGMATSLTIIQNILSLSKVMSDLLVGFVFSLFIVFIMYWFFGTEMGCAIRATGKNDSSFGSGHKYNKNNRAYDFKRVGFSFWSFGYSKSRIRRCGNGKRNYSRRTRVRNNRRGYFWK